MRAELYDDLFATVTREIAASRGITVAQVEQLIDAATLFDLHGEHLAVRSQCIHDGIVDILRDRFAEGKASDPVTWEGEIPNWEAPK